MREIYTRRSIRKYLTKEVKKDIINEILRAGMNAPSAKNLRPYEFVVVRDKDMLTKLASVKINAYMVNGCAFAIVVLAKETTEFWQQDIGACVQNMLLMAEYYDVGSCWIGISDEQGKQIGDLLDIPSEYRIKVMISFGMKGEKKEANSYFNESKIHYEKF